MNNKKISLLINCLILCCSLVSCSNKETEEIVKVDINNTAPTEEATINTSVLETVLTSNNETKEEITTITTEITTTEVVSTKENNPTILTIGNYDINFDEYRYYYLNLANSKDEDDIDTIKNYVLTHLLNNYSVEAIAQDYNITLTDEEIQAVEDEYNQTKASYESSEDAEYDTFEDYLTSTYCTKELYLKSAIRQALEEKVVRILYENDFRANLLPQYIHCQHILFSTTDLNETEKEQIKSKAESVLKKIKDGANFEEMIAKYNEDSNETINDDGSVDGYYFKSSTMLQEFEDVAFTLSDNEISDLVETSYGYHIIKRIPITNDDKFINENMLSLIMYDINTGETTEYYDKYLELAEQYVDKLNSSILYSDNYYELDFESIE